MSGRVAAILELGMGFNPDLTARQNAYHSAGLMGYGHADIARTMPEIEAFAEIGEYFDQPVRTYSSGMQMRVAFSVATAFKPDLLIVDEALSVGDSYFQHKSFDRIRQFRNEGVSIMLVTHSMSDVRTLCDRVILLDKGIMLRDGQPDEVVDYYNALIAAKENAKLTVEQRREKDGWLSTKSGTGEARVNSIKLLDATTGEELVVAKVGQALEVKLNVSIYSQIPQLVLGLKICDKQGHVVWGTNTWHTRQIEKNIKAKDTIEYKIKFCCALGAGSYSISPALVSTDTHLVNNYEWVDNMFVFEVINVDRYYFIGSSWLDANFSICRQSHGVL
jgi:lipopolysaccharide transport system ATP-binding protein